MTSQHYQVRIADLLSIADPGVRWIIIKKALAADAMRDDTRPIEAAYRDLDRAEDHLRRIAEESNEFLFLPMDKEPRDEADKVSGSPQLLEYAKRLHKAPKRAARSRPVEVVEDEAPGSNGVHSAAEAIEHSEIELEADDDVVASVEPVAEEHVEMEPVVEADDVVASVEPVAEEHVEMEPVVEAEIAPADVIEDAMPAVSDADMIKEVGLGAPERAQDDAGEEIAEPERTSSLEGSVDASGVSPEEIPLLDDDHFEISLQKVLDVPQRRARWILLKKLVGHVVKRKHVRSVPVEMLGNEENAARVVRAAGETFRIRRGHEAGDMSDFSRRAVSLERFALTGDWQAESLPPPESMLRRRLAKQQEAQHGEEPVETEPQVAPSPAPDAADEAEPRQAEQQAEAPLRFSDIDLEREPGVAEELLDAPLAHEREQSPRQLDLDAVAETGDAWLEAESRSGRDVRASAEWLARRYEAEAARLRMKALNGDYGRS